MIDQKFTHSFALGDIAAGTARTIYVWRAPRKVKVRAAYLHASTNVATDASDYVTVSLKVGSNTVAAINTSSSGSAITAGTPAAMTITEANAVVAAGSTIAIVVAHTGSSGRALDEPSVQFDADPIE